MPEPMKIGLLSCSGECRASGALARVATRLVRDQYRPDHTVTLCVPPFLAGGEEERAFAREQPTLTIDGCGKQCARIATERLSGPVAGSLVVEEELDLPASLSRREPAGGGLEWARQLAGVIALRVDRLLAEGASAEMKGNGHGSL